jgi:phospholipase C
MAALDGIRHIVVLMMENRSFDHMLGHLKLDGRDDVDGLSADMSNLGPDGKPIAVHAFHADGNAVQRSGEALNKGLDPDHSPAGVGVQLGPGYGDSGQNAGFVKAFVDSRKETLPSELWGVPMGYYTAEDVMLYNHLATEYCVCDRWHSSIPGDTWPNRCYALAGEQQERRHHTILDRLPGPFHKLESLPIFELDAFTHQLDDGQWRWYSHDPATLRAADAHYRDFLHLNRGNFAYFDRKKVSELTQEGESLLVGHDSFLDDAAKGQLRDVSWIDPNFIDLSVLDPSSNDDHPPSDIRAGQAFVLEVYEALRRSQDWEDTLFVIVYDEHGGFFDHVPPPEIEDDGSGYGTLGVRVPALIVGPRVKRLACHQVFDHTTLIRTILRRFAADPERALQNMPTRVANGPRLKGEEPSAPDLGIVLEDEPRTDIADNAEARDAIDAWRTAARERRRASVERAPAPAPDGAGQPFVLQDFQEEFSSYALAMQHLGLPHGQP